MPLNPRARLVLTSALLAMVLAGCAIMRCRSTDAKQCQWQRLIFLRLWRGLMIASVLLVLVVELLNSAIEAVVDRVSLENHRLAKRAKDIGSAAVLVSLLSVVVVWACVLLEAA